MNFEEHKSRRTRSVSEFQASNGPNSLSRRGYLALGSAVAVSGLAGCLGGSGEEEGPEPPWTTSDLVDQIDGDETVTIYAGTGTDQQWYDLVQVINDEFGTDLTGDVYADAGGPVSQRFLQEKQANEDKADVLANISDIQDDIKITGLEDGEEEARQLASQYFETDVDQNFWFGDVLDDWHLLEFMIPAFNGGANISMPINQMVFDERGLDVPTSYNDLFDDQYEGATMLIPSYVVPKEAGWIIERHSNEMDMGRMEWINAFRDHFNFEGASSHSSATREIAQGNALLMLYNFPNVQQAFMREFPDLRGVFPEGVYWPADAGGMFINKDAPNPWVARFFMSAMLEAPVQRRMLDEVRLQTPVRLDLDYSDIDTNRFNRRRITVETERIGFYETAEYARIGNQVREEGKFDVS